VLLLRPFSGSSSEPENKPRFGRRMTEKSPAMGSSSSSRRRRMKQENYRGWKITRELKMLLPSLTVRKKTAAITRRESPPPVTRGRRRVVGGKVVVALLWRRRRKNCRVVVGMQTLVWVRWKQQQVPVHLHTLDCSFRIWAQWMWTLHVSICYCILLTTFHLHPTRVLVLTKIGITSNHHRWFPLRYSVMKTLMGVLLYETWK